MVSHYDSIQQTPEVATGGQLVRVAPPGAALLTIFLDGVPLTAHAADTLLVAVLTQRPHLRRHDADGTWRAGFCLMGACQDCWVWFEGGGGGRACTIRVSAGLRVLTQAPAWGPGA